MMVDAMIRWFNVLCPVFKARPQQIFWGRKVDLLVHTLCSCVVGVEVVVLLVAADNFAWHRTRG